MTCTIDGLSNMRTLSCWTKITHDLQYFFFCGMTNRTIYGLALFLISHTRLKSHLTFSISADGKKSLTNVNIFFFGRIRWMLSLFYFTGEDWSLKGNQTDLLSYFFSFSLLDVFIEECYNFFRQRGMQSLFCFTKTWQETYFGLCVT